MPKPVINHFTEDGKYLCTGCKTAYPISHYSKNKGKPKGINQYCRSCQSTKNKEYQRRLKKGELLHTKCFYKKGTKEHNDHTKNQCLRYAYNITLDKYNTLFAEQLGCCAICGIHQSKLTKSLGVDHNHTTGRVRGLLCTKCNTGIGHLNENIDILNKSIDYLRLHDIIEVMIDDAASILAGDVENQTQYQREKQSAEENN